MFNILEKLNERLYNRYLTVERNIKAASNSFYDAYLDMLEQFVNIIVEENQLNYTGTCGKILMQEGVKNFFVSTLGFDEFTYNKMRDYTQKVNSHKHKGEKDVNTDTVVTYMKIFHSAVEYYTRYKGEEAEKFDGNYFIRIFGEFEKSNQSLKVTVDKLKEELMSSVEEHRIKETDIKTYKELLSQAELEKLSLEEQNIELYRQISVLKDIKLSSMEDKLNKTIDLLNNLTESVKENRIIVRAIGKNVGGLINGDRDVDAWIAKETEEGNG